MSKIKVTDVDKAKYWTCNPASRIKTTETEIFAENLSKQEYDRLNRVASRVAHELGARRTTEKTKIQGAWVYTSSYETEKHIGYCFQVGHPQADGRNIHAHDEFYLPIRKALLEKPLNQEE